jgi:4'-phosphopantetheinyl transferase EntD
VTRSDRFGSIGLDIEVRDAMEPELWRTVFIAPELRWLEGQPEKERATWATVLFSAKECAYKCQYPAYGEIWGFREVGIALAEDGRFTVMAPDHSLLAGVPLVGRYRISGHSIATAMVLADSRIETPRRSVKVTSNA